MAYSIVTLCGSWNYSKEWVNSCIESWKKIENADHSNYYLIPDADLNTKDKEALISQGFIVFDEYETQLATHLDTFPHLKKLREEDLTWRKIVDVCWLRKNKGKVILIDTDVLVVKPCKLPENDFDICYMREDIPAYRAHWSIVFKEKMVPALNAGLVIFDPETINFNHLEYLAEKYLISCKNYWWSEQAAWACIAGGLQKRAVFDGEQVRVLSASKKRTPKEVLENKFKYFGKRGQFTDFKDFKPFLTNSTIVHFAGPGKRFFEQSKNYLLAEQKENSTVAIQAIPEENLSLINKLGIAARLFVQEKR